MDFSCPGARIYRERWDDVLWDQNKIAVHSLRTEHYEERAYRQVSLYPELLPFLLDAAERADGSGFVVTRIRDSESNLRTTFLKIIKQGRPEAVAEVIPKPQSQQADGIAGDLPRTRWLCMDGQQPEGGSEAPSAGDRRAFRKNAAATRRQPRKIAAMLQ